ncbi:hypothetical protein [Candidatus Methylomirabilis sp.]|uniref:hypothetical protein n=1 Tax=Candidatus Methylomirabilis sp. TaxID=2032687 RepID=UPI0030762062
MTTQPVDLLKESHGSQVIAVARLLIVFKAEFAGLVIELKLFDRGEYRLLLSQELLQLSLF